VLLRKVNPSLILPLQKGENALDSAIREISDRLRVLIMIGIFEQAVMLVPTRRASRGCLL
jgi:hypothetical protein